MRQRRFSDLPWAICTREIVFVSFFCKGFPWLNDPGCTGQSCWTPSASAKRTKSSRWDIRSNSFQLMLAPETSEYDYCKKAPPMSPVCKRNRPYFTVQACRGKTTSEGIRVWVRVTAILAISLTAEIYWMNLMPIAANSRLNRQFVMAV